MVAYRFSTIQAEIGVFRAGRQLKAEGVSGKGKLADSPSGNSRLWESVQETDSSGIPKQRKAFRFT
jgi:hypothetical protein